MAQLPGWAVRAPGQGGQDEASTTPHRCQPHVHSQAGTSKGSRPALRTSCTSEGISCWKYRRRPWFFTCLWQPRQLGSVNVITWRCLSERHEQCYCGSIINRVGDPRPCWNAAALPPALPRAHHSRHKGERSPRPRRGSSPSAPRPCQQHHIPPNAACCFPVGPGEELGGEEQLCLPGYRCPRCHACLPVCRLSLIHI